MTSLDTEVCPFQEIVEPTQYWIFWREDKGKRLSIVNEKTGHKLLLVWSFDPDQDVVRFVFDQTRKVVECKPEQCSLRACLTFARIDGCQGIMLSDGQTWQEIPL